MEQEKYKIALLALAEVFIPSLKHSNTGKQQVWQNFLYFFNDLDRNSQRKLCLLLSVLKILSFIRYGKTYPCLSHHKRHNFVHSLLYSPIKLLVAGVSGLKSLIFMAHYSNKEVWPQLDYQGPIVSREL